MSRKIVFSLLIIGALLFTTIGVQARESHVRWIDYQTVQISFVNEPGIYFACYQRWHPIELPQGASIGCITPKANQGIVYFELSKNPDVVYTPIAGDSYRIIIHKVGTIAPYGAWMPIENEQPLQPRSWIPIIKGL